MSTEKKPKKVKLVRDSFCMPKDEYAALDMLKQRALGMNKAVKKSELLRAGVLALSRANESVFLAYIEAVPNLKTGRPATKTTTKATEGSAQPKAKTAAPRRKTATKPPVETPVSPTPPASTPNAAPVKQARTRNPVKAKAAAT